MPRIVETWIDKVAQRRESEDEGNGQWIATYRAFGVSALHQVAVRLRGRRARLREASSTVTGRVVAAARKSGASTCQVVDDLLLLVPATLRELRSYGGTVPRGDEVIDQIRSAVMAVARGLESMAARMERERSETVAARTELLIHELHNTFGAADTASQLLIRRSLPPESDWLQRIASLIQSAVDEGLRTIEDMRVRTPDEWPVALPVLVRDVVRAHEAMAADRGINLQTCGSLPDVLVDGSTFRMILANLIGNALAHHDHAKHERTVTVTASRPDRRLVVVTVTDNGPGIGKGRLEQVFLPNGGSRNGRAGRGEGFGLAVVREAVERMSGTIEVASERGIGTTFRISFAPLV